MKFCYHPLSTYCRKVMIALYEKNIEFDGVLINLMDEEEKAKYIDEVNPFGKIPFLMPTADQKVFESTTIIEYLELQFPHEKGLIPSDPELARQARLIDRLSDNYLMTGMGFIFFENRKPENERNRDMIKQHTHNIHTTLNLFNDLLDGKKFFIDSHLTLADLSPLCAVYYLEMMQFPLNDWPNVKTWYDNVKELPSFQRIVTESEPHLAKFFTS